VPAGLKTSLLEAAKRHGVILQGEARETAWSIVSSGNCKGKEVYVKVLSPHSDERLAPALLELWRAGPVVRVHAASEGVHIFERLTPGTSLEEHYKATHDDESLGVLGTIAASLRQLGARDIGFPDARSRGRSLLVGSRPGCIDKCLWDKAARRYSDLADSQQDIGVTHGDIHHCNVLWDASRGWIAIDPKGVMAELEYEMACALRNPISRVSEWVLPEQLSNRARLLARTLGLREDRLLAWSFAQSILAAAWEVEDALDPSPWIVVARAYDSLIEARTTCNPD